jgi:tripartite-type tricarboxylate transporter receptor subunit TctC
VILVRGTVPFPIVEKSTQTKGETRAMEPIVFLRKAFLFVLMISLVAASGLIADAQDKFPSRPITVVCPWGAGGATDTIARIVAVVMEKELGQPVNVVNRTGGGGAVGHTAAATATPNGYTLCLATTELAMMHWMGLAQITYKDFKAVGRLATNPAGVNVRADAPWKNLNDLQEYIKANPGKLKASGVGPGGIWDLARAGWLKTVGLPVNSVPWVPSNGAAPALQELLAGGIDIVPCSLPEARALIDAKKVKALGIMADKRAELFPDVPTLKEMGVNWSIGAWWGITVPKETPVEIIAVLEKSVKNITASQPFKEFMQKNGFTISYLDSAQFQGFLIDDDETKGRLLKEAGIVK